MTSTLYNLLKMNIYMLLMLGVSRKRGGGFIWGTYLCNIDHYNTFSDSAKWSCIANGGINCGKRKLTNTGRQAEQRN